MQTMTADLSRLTGLRSGKSSFYPQYRGAAERLERVVHALELISRALVRTVEGRKPSSVRWRKLPVLI